MVSAENLKKTIPEYNNNNENNYNTIMIMTIIKIIFDAYFVLNENHLIQRCNATLCPKYERI